MGKDFHLPDEVITLPLKEGEVYKNYKELCKVLKEKERTGGARQNQHRHWALYFDYEKEGNKYIIKTILNNVYPRWDTVTGRQRVKEHSLYIQKLILNLIYNYSKENKFLSNINDIVLSNKNLAIMLSMVNKSYYYYYLKMNEFAEENDISLELMQDFYMRYNSMIAGDIKTALNQLASRKLIYVEQVTVYRDYITNKLTKYEELTLDDSQKEKRLKEITEHWDKNVYADSEGKKPKGIYGSFNIASSEELKKILEVEHATMKSLGAPNTQALWAMGKFKSYQRNVIYYLREYYGFAYYFKAYKVVFSPELLQHIKQEGTEVITLNGAEEVALQKTLNQAMQENIRSNYQRNLDSLQEFLEKGDYFGEYLPMLPKGEVLMHEHPIEDVDTLIDSLIARKEK